MSNMQDKAAELCPSRGVLEKMFSNPSVESEASKTVWKQITSREISVDDGVARLEKLALKGDSFASQHLMEIYHANGDRSKALEYMEQSAKAGNPYAQNAFGVAFAGGMAVYDLKFPQDFESAKICYSTASAGGDEDAYHNLGQLYWKGAGVQQDKQEACRNFKKAADMGSALGQYNVGICYSNGDGMPRNEKLGETYIRKAAEQGLPVAQQALLRSRSSQNAPLPSGPNHGEILRRLDREWDIRGSMPSNESDLMYPK